MGHRLSKSTLAGSNVATNKSQRKRNSAIIQSITNRNSSQSESGDSTLNASHPEQASNAAALGPTINVNAHLRLEARTDPNYSANGPRQIIIKIQLAKMESGENDAISSPSNSNIDGVATVTTTASNNNLNIERSNLMVNAISFPRNIACDQGNEIKLNNLDAGTSVLLNNNNFVSNFAAVPYIDNDSDDARNWTNVQKLNMMMRQMYIDNGSGSQQGNNNNESGSNRSSTSSSELNDIVPDISAERSLCSNATRTRRLEEESHCCREKKLKSSSSSSSSATSNSVLTTSSTKWQCCKCTCRNALKIFRPSTSKKFNQLPTSSSNSNKETQPLTAASTPSISTNEMPPAANNHLTLWSGNDVIFPLAPQQILVVQYPPASHLVTLGSIAHLDEHGLRLVAGDLAIPTTPESSTSMAPSPGSTISSATTPNGTVIHSQVDYIHCLVPDLEKITKSTFYWGKMDRYEAERLLEGKAEGTFLLRDSAQEEYLFSVTFRKYGRSLHARIEQFNHRFSFDCHDPGVYTAETITGLLEHYKDPSCVMFFEPMLTIPLHRNTTFSLQQLCRATIVSNTTYDGINEMEIPSRLKSYLKEYHYKQRVRVKPLDEPLYSCA